MFSGARLLEGVVGKPVRVRVPPSAPSQYSKGIRFRDGFPFFVKTANGSQMGPGCAYAIMPFVLPELPTS
jgi:hypothetical protein